MAYKTGDKVVYYAMISISCSYSYTASYNNVYGQNYYYQLATIASS